MRAKTDIQSREEFEKLLAEKRKAAGAERIVFDGYTFSFETEYNDFSSLDLSNCNFKNCTFKKFTQFEEAKLATTTFAGSVFEKGIILNPDQPVTNTVFALGNYSCDSFYCYRSSPTHPLRVQLLCEDLVEGYILFQGRLDQYPNHESNPQTRTQLAWRIINSTCGDRSKQQAFIYATAKYAASEKYKSEPVKLDKNAIKAFDQLFNLNKLFPALIHAIEKQCIVFAQSKKRLSREEKGIYKKLLKMPMELLSNLPTSDQIVQMALYFSKELFPASSTIFLKCFKGQNLTEEQCRELFQMNHIYNPELGAKLLAASPASDSDEDRPPSDVTAAVAAGLFSGRGAESDSDLDSNSDNCPPLPKERADTPPPEKRTDTPAP